MCIVFSGTKVVKAQFHYILSNNALTLTNNEKELILPLNTQDFITFYHKKYKIKEKLGSYKPKNKIVNFSRNLTFDTIYKVSPYKISIHLNFDFKHKKEQAEILITNQENNFIIDFINISNSNINSFSINIQDDAKAIFGGGIQFSNCNLKGEKFPLIVEENGVGRGDKGSTFWASLLGAAGNKHTTYAPLPFFHTSNKISYSLHAIENHYWSVDFTQEDLLQFHLNTLNKRVLDSKPSICIEYSEPIKLVSNRANYQLKLKDWMYGFILGIQGGKNKVDSVLNTLQRNDIKPSAVWIQDWVGKRKTAIGSRLQWDWRVNENVYPKTKQWVDSLHQNNIKVLGYINPYFVEDGLQANEGTKNSYFVRNKKNEAYKFKAGGFNAYMIDLSNEKARIWMKDIIKKELIANGFDGWMCDFGEWLPFFPNIENDSFLYHNNFSSEWLKLNNEAALEVNKADELFIFNRSAYTETLTQKNIMWLGDQMANFGKNDGLASAINAYNSASLAGFPLVHSDIGGYTAIQFGAVKFLRDKESLFRWIEMEAFTPLFRSHEGLMPENMEQIYGDKENMEFFKKFHDVHLDLLPYFKKVNQDYNETGQPMIRHPYLLFPEDENTYDLQYQFFVGDSLLICPVIEENTNQLKVYLPEGNWEHFFTKKNYLGNQYITLDTPLGKPAVFWLKY